jgi:hypothetical protein
MARLYFNKNQKHQYKLRVVLDQELFNLHLSRLKKVNLHKSLLHNRIQVYQIRHKRTLNELFY